MICGAFLIVVRIRFSYWLWIRTPLLFHFEKETGLTSLIFLIAACQDTFR
jgi:hypothetical protein